MKKKSLLILCISGLTAAASAQVKIGHDAAGTINDAAILELSNHTGGNPEDWKSLVLPSVDFSNTTIFGTSAAWGISGSATEGAVVYNTGNRSGDGFAGKGAYVWSEGAWRPVTGGGSGSASNCSDPGQTTGDKGCVSVTYRGQQATYTTVRAADGKIWLTQNLGSLQKGTQPSDAPAYGDYFQWGRWDDGHQSAMSSLTTAVASPNNPVGLGMGNPSFLSSTSSMWWTEGSETDEWAGTTPSGKKGKDPCAALGAGWHLPSQLEWVNAFNRENITDTASAFRSNLTLVTAGYRLFDGSFAGKGTYMTYWSSTPNSPAPPTGMGMAVSVHKDNSSGGVSTSNMYPRGLGIPVRCVKD